MSFAFEEAHAFASRVGRMYLYQWQADSEGRFDAGLIRPDGSSRPALEVVRTQLAAMAGPGRTPGATASAPGAPGAPHAVPGPVTVRASGAADVRLRCPTGVTPRCAGRLWIEDAALATVTLVNGRLPAYVLRPVGRPFRAGRGPRRARALRGAPLGPRSCLGAPAAAPAAHGRLARRAVRAARPLARGRVAAADAAQSSSQGTLT